MKNRFLQAFVQHLKHKHINVNFYAKRVIAIQQKALSYHYSLYIYTGDLFEIKTKKHYRIIQEIFWNSWCGESK